MDKLTTSVGASQHARDNHMNQPARRSGGKAVWSNLNGRMDAGGDVLRLSWCVRMGMPEKYTAAAQERAKQVLALVCVCVYALVCVGMYVREWMF